jgi:hypothetical protein
METIEFISLFAILAGFILGLGSVIVIDLHGFLARKSSYWTEATIRTHKVTKPLIWLGILLVIVGEGFFYQNSYTPITLLQFMLVGVLILNGIFLSFIVSSELLKREKEGKASELLPSPLQKRIQISFFVSFFGWWSSLALLVWTLLG